MIRRAIRRMSISGSKKSTDIEGGEQDYGTADEHQHQKNESYPEQRKRSNSKSKVDAEIESLKGHRKHGQPRIHQDSREDQQLHSEQDRRVERGRDTEDVLARAAHMKAGGNRRADPSIRRERGNGNNPRRAAANPETHGPSGRILKLNVPEELLQSSAWKGPLPKLKNMHQKKTARQADRESANGNHDGNDGSSSDFDDDTLNDDLTSVSLAGDGQRLKDDDDRQEPLVFLPDIFENEGDVHGSKSKQFDARNLANTASAASSLHAIFGGMGQARGKGPEAPEFPSIGDLPAPHSWQLFTQLERQPEAVQKGAAGTAWMQLQTITAVHTACTGIHKAMQETTANLHSNAAGWILDMDRTGMSSASSLRGVSAAGSVDRVVSATLKALVVLCEGRVNSASLTLRGSLLPGVELSRLTSKVASSNQGQKDQESGDTLEPIVYGWHEDNLVRSGLRELARDDELLQWKIDHSGDVRRLGNSTDEWAANVALAESLQDNAVNATGNQNRSQSKSFLNSSSTSEKSKHLSSGDLGGDFPDEEFAGNLLDWWTNQRDFTKDLDVEPEALHSHEGKVITIPLHGPKSISIGGVVLEASPTSYLMKYDQLVVKQVADFASRCIQAVVSMTSDTAAASSLKVMSVKCLDAVASAGKNHKILLKSLTTALGDVFPRDVVAVSLIDDEGVQWSRGSVAPTGGKIDAGLVGFTKSVLRPVVFARPLEDPRYAPDIDVNEAVLSADEANTCTLLALPAIVTNGADPKVVGMVQIIRRHAVDLPFAPFGKQDIAVAHSCSNTLASALHVFGGVVSMISAGMDYVDGSASEASFAGGMGSKRGQRQPAFGEHINPSVAASISSELTDAMLSDRDLAMKLLRASKRNSALRAAATACVAHFDGGLSRPIDLDEVSGGNSHISRRSMGNASAAQFSPSMLPNRSRPQSGSGMFSDGDEEQEWRENVLKSLQMGADGVFQNSSTSTVDGMVFDDLTASLVQEDSTKAPMSSKVAWILQGTRDHVARLQSKYARLAAAMADASRELTSIRMSGRLDDAEAPGDASRALRNEVTSLRGRLASAAHATQDIMSLNHELSRKLKDAEEDRRNALKKAKGALQLSSKSDNRLSWLRASQTKRLSAIARVHIASKSVISAFGAVARENGSGIEPSTMNKAVQAFDSDLETIVCEAASSIFQTPNCVNSAALVLGNRDAVGKGVASMAIRDGRDIVVNNPLGCSEYDADVDVYDEVLQHKESSAKAALICLAVKVPWFSSLGGVLELLVRTDMLDAERSARKDQAKGSGHVSSDSEGESIAEGSSDRSARLGLKRHEWSNLRFLASVTIQSAILSANGKQHIGNSPSIRNSPHTPLNYGSSSEFNAVNNQLPALDHAVARRRGERHETSQPENVRRDLAAESSDSPSQRTTEEYRRHKRQHVRGSESDSSGDNYGNQPQVRVRDVDVHEEVHGSRGRSRLSREKRGHAVRHRRDHDESDDEHGELLVEELEGRKATLRNDKCRRSGASRLVNTLIKQAREQDNSSDEEENFQGRRRELKSSPRRKDKGYGRARSSSRGRTNRRDRSEDPYDSDTGGRSEIPAHSNRNWSRSLREDVHTADSERSWRS